MKPAAIKWATKTEAIEILSACVMVENDEPPAVAAGDMWRVELAGRCRVAAGRKKGWLRWRVYEWFVTDAAARSGKDLFGKIARRAAERYGLSGVLVLSIGRPQNHQARAAMTRLNQLTENAVNSEPSVAEKEWEVKE